VAAAVIACALSAVQAIPATAHPGTLTWLTTGDSYSSGEGVTEAPGLLTPPTRAQACGQDSKAWGQAAASLLKDKWTIEKQVFSACTGRPVRDFYARYGDQTSIWEWTKEQGLPPGNRFDVATMTFGGNDVNFKDVLLDCLPGSNPLNPKNWSDLLDPRLDSCDVTEQELDRRVDALAASFDFDKGSPGGFASAAGPMSAFYRAVLDRHVTARGHLVVLGYPRLLAPTSEWAGWHIRCAGIKPSDAEMLGRVGDRLDTTLAAQAKAANRGPERVHYQSVIQLFRTGGHELCGTGDAWINGITGRDNFTGSFHPTALGYAAEGKAAADLVRAFPWTLDANRPATTLATATDDGAVIPDAVMRKVTSIYEAARKRDYAAVAALAGPQFTYTFGRPSDPASYWQATAKSSGVDPMASLVTILETLPTVSTGSYQYPYFFGKPIGRWTGPDFELAAAIYPGQPAPAIAAHDRCPPDNNDIPCVWIGYRASFKADGTWTSFVAGD
jgi:lysophospholipase L1-like esterase